MRVVFETYGVLLIRSRDKRRAAMTFLDLVATGTCRVERVRRADETNAISILRSHEVPRSIEFDEPRS